jgi:hypothetical protein
MRTLKLLLVGMVAVVLLAASGVAVTAQSVRATNGGEPLLGSCFETPGVQPMTANRPGYTYRTFTNLRSGCGVCSEACADDADCIAWTCFHPTHFGAGGILPGPRPIACHLKNELPIPSPNPCAPPPRAPTYGNGVHDDRCYTSTQAPMTLPRRPERERGVLSTISIADPALAQSINQELLAERSLIADIYADLAKQKLGGLFDRPLLECGAEDRLRPSASPAFGPAVGPGLVTGPDAREAFEALRRGNLLTFVDFEKVRTGPRGKLRLDGPAKGITIKMRTTEFRYPLPPKRAPSGTSVIVLPYSFVSEPPNHRLMGANPGDIPDGQAKYKLVLSEPVSHAGLLRMWNTYSLTRFYSEAGTLLAEHRNTTNDEFVGYVADGPENRVKTIELDAVPSEPKSKSNKLFQVGSVDDLYVGNG